LKKLVVFIKENVRVLILLPVLGLACYILFTSSPKAAVHADIRGNEDQEDVVWYVPTDKKFIALTFDDGPDPVFTPKVVDILDKYDVKGTFFVIGKSVEEYPETAKLIVERGHEIGNHTYSHTNLGHIEKDLIQEEVDKAQEAILSATDTQPCLFRPPHGTYNDTVVDIVRDMGYRVVLWSWTQDTIDWCNPGTNYIINKVLNNAHSGDIIIFHDAGGDRSQTVMALEPIILELQKRNFQMVTVSELLAHESEDTRELSGISQDTFMFE
jgi:polysaccharide deacetylase family sporulation protein PdaB